MLNNLELFFLALASNNWTCDKKYISLAISQLMLNQKRRGGKETRSLTNKRHWILLASFSAIINTLKITK